MALELGDDPSTATGEYDATMRRCVKLVSTSRTPLEAQQRGERVLRSLLPPGFEVGFRIFISALPEWFVARHAAKVTPFLLPWLVGPSKVIDAPFQLPVDDAQPIPANAVYSALNGLKLEVAAARIAARDADAGTYDFSREHVSLKNASDRRRDRSDEDMPHKPPGFADSGYQQGVLLERCRVLEASGCASVCLNVCKLPTQAFFNETVGLAVTLVPDYETFECRFVYGKTPPPPDPPRPRFFRSRFSPGLAKTAYSWRRRPGRWDTARNTACRTPGHVPAAEASCRTRTDTRTSRNPAPASRRVPRFR